jgi:hypothetical protein
MINMHKQLEFEQTEEETKSINYLDPHIHRKITTQNVEFTVNPHNQTLYISLPTIHYNKNWRRVSSTQTDLYLHPFQTKQDNRNGIPYPPWQRVIVFPYN